MINSINEVTSIAVLIFLPSSQTSEKTTPTIHKKSGNWIYQAYECICVANWDSCASPLCANIFEININRITFSVPLSRVR